MREDFDLTISINIKDACVVVEQQGKDGVVSTKRIPPHALTECIQRSRYDDEERVSGLLPENCLSVRTGRNFTTFFIRYPELYADITYQKTEYLHFPLPRLVFAFKYMPAEGKIAECRLCVVKDEKLTLETPAFWYPFSNVSNDGRICTGNNALPVYKDPSRLHTLAGYILRLPNNNDHYSSNHNRLNAEFRDLLEHLKDKEPGYYYTDILKGNHRTLNDFLNGR